MMSVFAEPHFHSSNVIELYILTVQIFKCFAKYYYQLRFILLIVDGGNGCFSLDGKQQFNISGGFKIVKTKLNHLFCQKCTIASLNYPLFGNKKDFSTLDRFQRCSMNITRVCSGVTYIENPF